MANYEGLDTSSFENHPSDIEKEVDSIIEICERRKIKATCFVVGLLARKKPHVVHALHAAGHEIASHGYAHKLVYQMKPEEFSEDLKQSCDILESITGKQVLGFRAPSWSIKNETIDWFYDKLGEQGIRYSSSVFPAHTYLYGIEGFEGHIHQPVINGSNIKVWEVPQRLAGVLGRKMGFAGGFYLRLFPKKFIIKQIKKQNGEGFPVFVYLHPRELNPQAQRLPLGFKDRLVHYWGVKGCRNKLEGILDSLDAPFVTLQDYINKLEK